MAKFLEITAGAQLMRIGCLVTRICPALTVERNIKFITQETPTEKAWKEACSPLTGLSLMILHFTIFICYSSFMTKMVGGEEPQVIGTHGAFICTIGSLLHQGYIK